MRINVLYVCTGLYSSFFNDFYFSCEKHFMPGVQKKYIVFTDEMSKVETLRDFDGFNNIEINTIDYLSWPLNTLLRFEYFYKVTDSLHSSGDDYTFFFNANTFFVKDVGGELLPSESHGYLMAVIHPGYINRLSIFCPFERRFNFDCRVPLTYSGNYFQGCLNGGRTSEFIRLITMCMNATRSDLKKNKIAKVHDESYLNWYFFKSRTFPLALSVDYAWPEEFGENCNAKIIMRDKSKCSWYSQIKNSKGGD